MKTEIANKKLEILNLIFKSKDGASWNEVSEMLNEFKKVCKDEAIAEHEKSKWKKYVDLLSEIEAWLCFNTTPSSEDTANVRKSINDLLGKK